MRPQARSGTGRLDPRSFLSLPWIVSQRGAVAAPSLTKTLPRKTSEAECSNRSDTGHQPSGTSRKATRAEPLDEATFAWIRRVFAEHPVLVFRDQNLGAAELAAFGRWFGSMRMHALVKYRHAEYPEVSWLTNVEDDGKVDWYGVKRATDWHTDSTYEADPPILAILHAKEIPSS